VLVDEATGAVGPSQAVHGRAQGEVAADGEAQPLECVHVKVPRSLPIL
jgi:hypothetical protein